MKIIKKTMLRLMINLDSYMQVRKRIRMMKYKDKVKQSGLPYLQFNQITIQKGRYRCIKAVPL